MAVEITEELVWQSIPRRARDSHKVPLAACWRWRAVPFTGALRCWQPRVHCAPGRVSLPLQA